MPLTEEKLQTAQQLVQEQLDDGHITRSNSPWNFPIFVIKKKSIKWRVIQDLREVNGILQPMGELQSGLPSPTAVPKDTHKINLDLKLFFIYHLFGTQDCQRFAFGISSVNFRDPVKTMSGASQGLAISAIFYQKSVVQAIQSARDLVHRCIFSIIWAMFCLPIEMKNFTGDIQTITTEP